MQITYNLEVFAFYFQGLFLPELFSYIVHILSCKLMHDARTHEPL
jgi:hypothetical protein